MIKSKSRKLISLIFVFSVLSSYIYNYSGRGLLGNLVQPHSIVEVLLLLFAIFILNYKIKAKLINALLNDIHRLFIPFLLLSYCLTDFYYSSYDGYPSPTFSISAFLPSLYLSTIYLILYCFKEE